MRINKDILWDSRIENIYDVLSAVKHRKILSGIFFICVDKKGVIQILSCRQIYKDINSPNDLKAIAAAKGKVSAFEMLARIYSEYCKKHGSIEGISDYYKY